MYLQPGQLKKQFSKKALTEIYKNLDLEENVNFTMQLQYNEWISRGQRNISFNHICSSPNNVG